MDTTEEDDTTLEQIKIYAEAAAVALKPILNAPVREVAEMLRATQATQELSPILCSIPDAAAMLGRGQRFIYEAAATGKIRMVKSNKRTLVVVASLHDYAATLPPAKIKPITRYNAVVRPDGQPRKAATANVRERARSKRGTAPTNA
jgi:hypothetical protein